MVQNPSTSAFSQPVEGQCLSETEKMMEADLMSTFRRKVDGKKDFQ
jgi:hypothetical protein